MTTHSTLCRKCCDRTAEFPRNCLLPKHTYLLYNRRSNQNHWLADFASKAYADEKFGGADTAPVVKLGEGKNLLELWHGPTCAFKDMALQMLPHLLTASLRKTGETRTACILVATSGDTGKAALDGFHDVPGTKIMVYYPVDGVSPMQKLQMVTQEGRNVEVVAIRGNFDDAQSAVKRIFTDEDARAALDKDGMMLSSANSINWGRLAPQIAYYVSAYCDMVAAGTIAQGDKINVCVPTGNFGNILAAYIAKKMGLPVNKFICASNRNNVLTDFFKKGGEYNRNRDFFTTTSPSMDILISSNLERLLFFASDFNDKLVAELMGKLNTEGSYKVAEDVFAKIEAEFDAGCCDDSHAADTINKLWKDENYLCDTHTAVAVRFFQLVAELMGKLNTEGSYKPSNRDFFAGRGTSVDRQPLRASAGASLPTSTTSWSIFNDNDDKS